MAQALWTITINKDNFSQLCTVGDPGQLISYNIRITGGYTHTITGSFTTDQNGIYANNLGSGSQYHGPIFYSQLPSQIGKANQYWHIIFKYSTTNPASVTGYLHFIAGFSVSLDYFDNQAGDSGFYRRTVLTSSTTSNKVHDVYSTTSGTYTYKIYHYQNNTTKIYLNGSLVFNGADPIVLDKGDNIVAFKSAMYQNYSMLYHRVQEITVSTDPSYDPQP